jgi:hypothetical protein
MSYPVTTSAGIATKSRHSSRLHTHTSSASCVAAVDRGHAAVCGTVLGPRRFRLAWSAVRVAPVRCPPGVHAGSVRVRISRVCHGGATGRDLGHLRSDQPRGSIRDLLRLRRTRGLLPRATRPAPPSRPLDDLLADIDQLDADEQVDRWVDWQLTQSPAAQVQGR